MISFIWAEANGGVIGADNGMPWHLPADLRYFKETTLGYPIVMGRKTFESFNSRPLPKRENIILTRDDSFQPDGVTVIHNKDVILQRARTEDLFVIGGANVFRQFMDHADRLYVTKINLDVEGDTVVDFIPWDDFQETSSHQGERNEQNPYDYSFHVYKRTRA